MKNHEALKRTIADLQDQLETAKEICALRLAETTKLKKQISESSWDIVSERNREIIELRQQVASKSRVIAEHIKEQDATAKDTEAEFDKLYSENNVLREENELYNKKYLALEKLINNRPAQILPSTK